MLKALRLVNYLLSKLLIMALTRYSIAAASRSLDVGTKYVAAMGTAADLMSVMASRPPSGHGHQISAKFRT